MATATAMAPSTILAVEKPDMVRHLHASPAFADRFLTHMLRRNIRIEEDLVDQQQGGVGLTARSVIPLKRSLRRTSARRRRYAWPHIADRECRSSSARRRLARPDADLRDHERWHGHRDE